MGSSVSSKITAWVASILIVIAIGCAISVDVPLFQRYNRAKEQRSELCEENAQLNEKLEKLQSDQERFRTDPEFVEHLARKNHRLRPGEILFVFDTPEDEK